MGSEGLNSNAFGGGVVQMKIRTPQKQLQLGFVSIAHGVNEAGLLVICEPNPTAIKIEPFFHRLHDGGEQLLSIQKHGRSLAHLFDQLCIVIAEVDLV